MESYRLVAAFQGFDVLEPTNKIDVINNDKHQQYDYDVDYYLELEERMQKQKRRKEIKENIKFGLLLFFFEVVVPVLFFLHWLLFGYGY